MPEPAAKWPTSEVHPAQGPLAGIRVIELAGQGAAPFGCMLLADLGADVIRIERTDGPTGPDISRPTDPVILRGRRSIAVDLKSSEGVTLIKRLAAGADVLVEGYRPGVVERLGLAPDDLVDVAPHLVYGRMTGWGQDGPLAQSAGHDINYIGVAGALGAIGRAGQPPSIPLSLVGDFGGGGLFLALGVAAALVERARSGRGQVIDAAMVDGAVTLMAPFFVLHDTGNWSEDRGTNFLDSAAPYYDSYETADCQWLAVGAIEPKFYSNFLAGLGLDESTLPAQQDRARWPELKRLFADTIRTQSLGVWVDRFDGADACASPVLSLAEVGKHPHIAARRTLVEFDGARHPVPTPRLSRTPGALGRPAPVIGEHTDEVLRGLGFGAAEIDDLRARKIIGCG
jgi:alpha-methylacyl-CoA racemase